MHLMTEPPTPGRRGPDPLTAIAIICIVAGGLILLFTQLAHADPVAPAPPPVPVAIDWQIWIALGIAALAGVRAIVDALLAFFRVVAPMTKTTVDDSIRDSLATAHIKLDKLAGAIGAMVKAPKPPGSGTVSMLAVLLLGALTGPALTGCATGRAALAAGTVAALDCEAAHLDAQALADARSFADAKVLQWLAGALAPDAGKIKADLAPIKSDLGRCAIAGALAAATALVAPAAPIAGTAISALSSSTAAPAAVRAQFEIGARLAGWPPILLAGGDVM